MTPSAPPEETVSRFADDLTRITGPLGDARVLVAVSGGPDSLALLLLAAHAFPGQVQSATVDHRLRPESGDEAAFVSGVAEALDVPHATLIITAMEGGNVPAAARAARYALLNDWADRQGIGWIATAHHADDQLETMVMRLNRGSGVAGLAGVRARQGRVVRPLLGWRREDLAEIVSASGLIAVDDPSNRDDRYDRARLRKALADADWLDPLAAAHSAEALAEANEAIAWAADTLAADRLTGTEDAVRLDPAGLPREIVRRLLIASIAKIDPDSEPRGASIDRAIEVLGEGGRITLGDVLGAGGSAWTFTRAAPRRSRG